LHDRFPCLALTDPAERAAWLAEDVKRGSATEPGSPFTVERPAWPATDDTADWLGGTLRIDTNATLRDYADVARFHYLRRRPAVVSRVIVARFTEPDPPGLTAGERLLHRIRLGALPALPRESDGATPAPDATRRTGKARRVRADDFALPPRVVGAVLIAYPQPMVAPRWRAIGGVGTSYGERVRFANANVRTIARVVVHPQFRAIGLATRLVRAAIHGLVADNAAGDRPVRWVEASSRLAWLHPVFERAGLTRVPPAADDEPAYFLAELPAGPGVGREDASPGLASFGVV
jgi:GNAT superfamily N-acetyltransferase